MQFIDNLRAGITLWRYKYFGAASSRPRTYAAPEPAPASTVETAASGDAVSPTTLKNRRRRARHARKQNKRK